MLIAFLDSVAQVDPSTYLLVGLATSFALACIFILSSKKPSSNEPLTYESVSRAQLFLLFIFTWIAHLIITRFAFGTWFLQDDAFDTCVMPYQLANREPIWGNGNAYLVYGLYALTYKIFGISVYKSFALGSFVFSAAQTLFFGAATRRFGRRSASFVYVIMWVSFPFLFHSIYSTAITFSFLAPALMALILFSTNQLTWREAIFVSLFFSFSPFLYGGAFLTCFSLLAGHILVFRNWWSRGEFFKLGTALVIAAGLAMSFKFALAPTHGEASNFSYWGGGRVGAGQTWEAVSRVLADTFYKSASWNAYNSGVPYIEPFFGVLFLAIAGVSFVALIRRRASEKERWIIVFALTYLLSTFLVGFSGPYPGVRRVFSSLIFVYLSVGVAMESLLQMRSFSKLPHILLVFSIAAIAVRTAGHANSTWPMTGTQEFVESSRSLASDPGHKRTSVIIVSYPDDQFSSEHFRCYLGFDKSVRENVTRVTVISRQILLDGQIGFQEQERILFLTNENFTSETLKKAFGRAPKNSIVFRQTSEHDQQHLVEAHEF